MKSDPLTALEAELAALRPCAPSTTLKGRIGARLGQKPFVWRFLEKQSRELRENWLAWGWGLAGVMTIALIISLWPLVGDRAIPSAAESEPPSSHVVHYQILSARDEGVVVDEDGQPLRQVRYTADETVRWLSPRTGASIQMSYPREETMLVPVSGN